MSVATTTTAPATLTPPDLGCDVVSMCVGEYVSMVLVACEDRRAQLSDEDEQALVRLQVLDRDGISRDEEDEALKLFGQLSASCL